MGKQGISIVDIAELAGVSKATVSNVLNGTGRVGEATRRRVLEIAEREGYVANSAARSLRAAETRTVGIITPDVSNDFFASIVMRMERTLYDEGYTSFVCDTEGDLEREASYVRSMLQKRVDGLAFVSNSQPLDLSLIPTGVPVVSVDRKVTGAREGLACVGNDVRAMTKDMANALLWHGRTHIAFVISTASPLPVHDNDRYLGFMEALAEAGARLDHRLVLRGMHEKPSHFEAYQLVDGLLGSGAEVDGIVAIGDRAAIGAMEALAAHGLSAGDEVLVIGCDDTPFCNMGAISLSSVNRHVDELATHATQSLLALMAGRGPCGGSVTVAHEVVERATTLGS